MTKKKSKSTASTADGLSSTQPTSAADANGSTEKLIQTRPHEPPTLLICRNKHWRYISSYHGPWLQLPPEVLESLAYSNFYSPRPRPIEPAVFFDLVKVRRLIEDATSLAVRAANGTTSAALSSSQHAGQGMLNGTDAEVLGLGVNRGGGHAKLSRERKFRMREHATQKLSCAYHLDEIATSVAMMQSASTLEDVAKLVLQRNETDPDAQYVHFFHEKIPSRSMAECTPLDSLNDIIRQRPTHGSPLRTRAVTRIFKNDFLGAARDLSEGLAIHRLYHAQHRNEQRELILARDAAKLAREYRRDATVDEKDQPSSLEPQLLFHRGGTSLTLACNQIAAALRCQSHKHEPSCREGTLGTTSVQGEVQRAGLEARKLVRTYAKRALRDYTAFLAHFDYTPGISPEFSETFLQKARLLNHNSAGRVRSERSLDIDRYVEQPPTSSALVRYETQKEREHILSSLPQITRPPVYSLDALFAPIPPANLPIYLPNTSGPISKPRSVASDPLASVADFTESCTYHPLLTDVLHSLLLAHSLVQTSPKELLRHAYMTARLTRITDGYPIFLAARSPARADWVEVLRRTNNWLGVQGKWEDLCTPPCAPSSTSSPSDQTRRDTQKEKQERAQRQAIYDALADDRVCDEESFRASVKARELRAAREEEEEQRKEYLRTHSEVFVLNGVANHNDHARHSNPVSEQAAVSEPQSRSDHEHPPNGKDDERGFQHENGHEPQNGSDSTNVNASEHLITTERAEVIARWILAAPAVGTGVAGKTKKKTARSGNGKEHHHHVMEAVEDTDHAEGQLESPPSTRTDGLA